MSYTNQGQYHFLAQNDVFAPDPLIARDKYDLKQFYDLAVQALRIDGKLYVLPFKAQIARLFAFYNVDISEKGGAGAHLLLDLQRPDGRHPASTGAARTTWRPGATPGPGRRPPP